MKKESIIDFDKNPKLAITCSGHILCEHVVSIYAGEDPISIAGTNVTDNYPDNNEDLDSDIYSLPTPLGKYEVISWRLTFVLFKEDDKYDATIHVITDDKVMSIANFSNKDEGQSGTLRIETGMINLERK